MANENEQISNRIRHAIRDLRTKAGAENIRAGQVLELLEKRSVEITPSVRAMTSKYLHARNEIREFQEKTAKKEPKMGPEAINLAFAAGQKRAKLAAELLQACDGDRHLAKLELDRLR